MIILALVTVLLSPWKGASLPTVPTANEYSKAYVLSVRGAPHEHVELRATGVAKGWIAAFCTQRLCAPFHFTATLDERGTARLEFELVRTDPQAARHTHAVITADNRIAASL